MGAGPDFVVNPYYGHGMDRYVDMVLRDTGHGSEIVEVSPSLCPNGHALRGPASRGNVQIFWGKAPDGQMRRGWRCWTCNTTTWGR